MVLVEPFTLALEGGVGDTTSNFQSAAFDSEAEYIRLITTLLIDASEVPAQASELLGQVDADRRIFIAALLRQINFPSALGESVSRFWLTLLDDEDLNVASLAIWWPDDYPVPADGRQVLDTVQRVQQRLSQHRGKLGEDDSGKSKEEAQIKLAAIIGAVADHVPLSVALEYFPNARAGEFCDWRPYQIHFTACTIASPEERAEAIGFIKRSKSNEEACLLIAAVARDGVSPTDLEWLRPYLEVKNDYSRPQAASLIAANAPEQDLREIVDAILSERKKEIRLGGQIILDEMINARRSTEWAVQRVVDLSTRKKLTKVEKTRIDQIRKLIPKRLLTLAKSKQETESPAQQTIDTEPQTESPQVSPVKKPGSHHPQLDFEQISKTFRQLTELVEQQKDVHIRMMHYDEVRSGRLIELNIEHHATKGYGISNRLNDDFPLTEVWQSWYECKKQSGLRESSVLEQIYVMVHLNRLRKAAPIHSEKHQPYLDLFVWDDPLLQSEVAKHVFGVVCWLASKNANAAGAQMLLDYFEGYLASIPEGVWLADADPYATRCRSRHSSGLPIALGRWERLINDYLLGFDCQFPPDVAERYWQLLRFVDQPAQDVPSLPPQMHITAGAFGAGKATVADLRETWRTSRMGGKPLQEATDVDEGANVIRKHAQPRATEYDAALNEFIDESVATALFQKSDDTDDAIRIAGRIRSYPGITRLMALLKSLGKKKLSRWNRQKRNEVTKANVLLRQLIAYSMPGDGETWEQFDSIVQQALNEKQLDEKRLLELALAAPQWAPWIGRSMSRTGLVDAVEWFIHQAGEDWIYTPPCLSGTISATAMSMHSRRWIKSSSCLTRRIRCG